MIQAVQRIVYLAPLRGRAYLSKRAAAYAEAGAMLRRKYPSEKSDPECGGGYHWSSDEKLVRVHRRLALLILKRTLSSTKAT